MSKYSVVQLCYGRVSAGVSKWHGHDAAFADYHSLDDQNIHLEACFWQSSTPPPNSPRGPQFSLHQRPFLNRLWIHLTQNFDFREVFCFWMWTGSGSSRLGLICDVVAVATCSLHSSTDDCHSGVVQSARAVVTRRIRQPAVEVASGPWVETRIADPGSQEKEFCSYQTSTSSDIKQAFFNY